MPPRQAIKAKVASATGIGVAEQRLLWGGYELLVSLEELPMGCGMRDMILQKQGATL